MMFILITLIIFFRGDPHENIFFLPFNPEKGKNIELTEIGAFGLQRSGRPGIPAHLHTGIDIKRPSTNYTNELIYPICTGKVISKRDDGPYAQLIIEHILNDIEFWTVYEHIAGILVSSGDSLFPNIPIARFMNRDELDTYGWQFDHFHFEILKIKPVALKTSPKLPERHFKSYTLITYSTDDLEKYFYDPVAFLQQYVN
jgi:Peptidase family M23